MDLDVDMHKDVRMDAARLPPGGYTARWRL